jgi:hypothetical protein
VSCGTAPEKDAVARAKVAAAVRTAIVDSFVMAFKPPYLLLSLTNSFAVSVRYEAGVVPLPKRLILFGFLIHGT